MPRSSGSTLTIAGSAALEDKIPDHSVFSRARNERFGDHDIFRHVFERVVAACIGAGLVGGKGFAVDASLIQADANKHRSIPGTEWNKNIDPNHARRAVKEYLATLDDPANGTAGDLTPRRAGCCSACFLSNSSANKSNRRRHAGEMIRSSQPIFGEIAPSVMPPTAPP